VCQIIYTCNYFTANKALVMILKLIVSALARLECATTSLGNVWKELLTVYLAIKKKKEKKKDFLVWPGYQEFKKAVPFFLDQRAQVYDELIHVVAFFLSRAY
ncbi:hypothetical protein CROQUDRAFT_19507, partial [Cronartium quercuum f. sp. fusiforme G11]